MKHFFAANLFRLLAGVLIVSAYTSCNKFDPEEEIPSYIHVDSIPLIVSDPTTQGTSSNKITDAWVYVDGQLIGAFELPATIPILSEGTHDVLIRAGVKENGLASIRAIYPFYKGWEQNVVLTPGTVAYLSPSVTYFPAIDFSSTFKENFDGAGVSIACPVPPTVAHLTVDANYGPFEGKSGHTQLDNDTTEFLAESSIPYTLVANSEVWLELNYKCNESFTIGIMDQGNPFGAVQIQPNETWNKIYIRLNDVIEEASSTVGGNSFYIYFAMRKTPTSAANPTLFLDNIKLLK